MYQPLVIRFWKKGASDYPVYDIVVTSKSHRYRGAFLERLGHYNPNGGEKLFFFDSQRLGYWLNRGAHLHSKISLHLPTEYSIMQASPKTVLKTIKRRKKRTNLIANRIYRMNLQELRQAELRRRQEEARRLTSHRAALAHSKHRALGRARRR